MWLEHAPEVTQRHGNMLPAAEVGRLTGFRSVYGFSEADAQSIIKVGHSRGFMCYELWADALFIDLDNGDSSVGEVSKFLKSKNVSHDLYFSGHKGYHFHIPHKLIHGFDVPATHSIYARKICGDVFDVSLYRPGSLFRLPGTVHHKSGRTKELVDRFMGQTLEIKHEEKTTGSLRFNQVGPMTADDLFPLSLMQAGYLFNNQPECGRRYQSLWSCGKSLFEAGLDRYTVSNLLDRINNSWADKKPADEMVRVLSDIYKE